MYSIIMYVFIVPYFPLGQVQLYPGGVTSRSDDLDWGQAGDLSQQRSQWCNYLSIYSNLVFAIYIILYSHNCSLMVCYNNCNE